jgi:hypothetical protein
VTWFRGIYWWDWPADGRAGETDEDFSPANLPAEATVRRWNGAPQRALGRPS